MNQMEHKPYAQLPHKKATFMAFVDAVIPPPLGGVSIQLDDYLVWILDHHISMQEKLSVKTVLLSTPAAAMLDASATQLMALKGMKTSADLPTYPQEGAFAALWPSDRFEAIRLLETLQIDLEALPSPYRNNADLVKNIVTFLHQMAMFGYYSEWFAYGSTRLAYPEDRVLEGRSFTWDLVDYPGVSYGYRALRGFPVVEFTEKEI
ncbi:hypothetical protein [Lentibacillus sp. CBA3610]|uniref:hypothetical protein n=1 Tax=Lentibacillus sp. CBA3610 TaxID=2518176 RepID=UPI001595F6E9|nr:hypothetical protein [Lentibacillus sp. CBA3610]QKY70654.1 hypothetical protein Len3610_14590 [Lentibacillus sp. CBA3610]